jgi:hypothetical protein
MRDSGVDKDGKRRGLSRKGVLKKTISSLTVSPTSSLGSAQLLVGVLFFKKKTPIII